MADSATPIQPSIPLRNLTSAVVTGSDGPTLQTALNTFLEAAGDNAFVVLVLRLADYEILIVYSE